MFDDDLARWTLTPDGDPIVTRGTNVMGFAALNPSYLSKSYSECSVRTASSV